MGVLRGRVLQPHGQSYFNDATLLAIGISIMSCSATPFTDLNLCANTAFQVKLQGGPYFTDRTDTDRTGPAILKYGPTDRTTF